MKRKLHRIIGQVWALIYYGVIAYLVDRPARVSFVNSVLGFHRRRLIADRFPSLELSEIFPDSNELQLKLTDYKFREGNVSFSELAVLAAIVRLRQPKSIFEIGTADGNTTLQFAINAPPECKITTLDIGSQSGRPLLRIDPGDKLFVGRSKPGERFRNSLHAGKIHQLICDSATFDPTPYRAAIDLIFVDGAHSYEYVQNDTLKALTMIRPGGLVIWHDYLVWNDVTDYLNSLSRTLRLVHIKGTSLVVHRNE